MAERTRILHVDDEPDFAELTATFLQRENDSFTVETAHSGSDALDMLAESAYDCVVADYAMPEIGGLEFLRAVREEYPSLPFILFTGKGNEDVASEAISAGVTDYIQKDPSPDRYVILANRITNAVERRRAQRQRQQHLDAIQTAQEGISILDEDGRYLFVNETYADLYGYEPDELVGEHWELTYPDDEVEFAYETILPAVERAGRWHGETTGVRADGSTFPEDHVVAGTEHSDLICAVRDISEQKEQEEKLQELGRLQDAIIDSANVWINVLDDDGNVVVWNRAAEEISGYTAEEVVGHGNIWEWLYPDEAYRNEILNHVDEILRGEKTVEDFETTIVTKHGEERILAWNQNRFGAGSDHEGAVATARDVTEHRERERQLEQFASIVSHDLRNPLNVATLRLDLARAESDSEHLEDVAQAHARMEALIEDLLTLAREGTSDIEAEQVGVAAAIEQCWQNVETRDARLVVETDRTIRADLSRLQQLGENLIRNAVEHGSTSNRTESDDAVERGGSGVTITVGELADGFYVEDDGPGIPPDERETVFEAGYSTGGGGTGFGLSIVSQVCEAHGWEIRATSGTDGGARFEITGVEFV